MFRTKCVEKIKTHFVFNNFFPKILPVIRNCGKNGTVRHATDDYMVHAHFTLDTSAYRHTLRICNIYCLSTTTIFPS